MPYTSVGTTAAGDWIKTILENVLNKVVWPVFFVLSIIMFVIAGAMFLTAAGDPGRITNARKALVYGVIGIVIAIIGFSAFGIIKNALGLP